MSYYPIATSKINSANGLLGLDSAGKVADSLLSTNVLLTSQKGVANGLATLDGTGKIPTSQIASSGGSSTVTTTQTGIAIWSTSDFISYSKIIESQSAGNGWWNDYQFFGSLNIQKVGSMATVTVSMYIQPSSIPYNATYDGKYMIFSTSTGTDFPAPKVNLNNYSRFSYCIPNCGFVRGGVVDSFYGSSGGYATSDIGVYMIPRATADGTVKGFAIQPMNSNFWSGNPYWRFVDFRTGGGGSGEYWLGFQFTYETA